MARKLITIVGALILGLLLVAMSCAPAPAPAGPADFYRDSTIDFTISEAPGGDDDLNGRLIAQYLGQDSGATVIVTNRREAGGMEGVVHIYKGKDDGLSMGTLNSTKLVMNKVMGEAGADYKIEGFSIIAGIGKEPLFLLVSPDGPYQSVADLQAGTDIKFVAGSPSGSFSLGGLTIIKVLDLDGQVITGFRGVSARNLAVKRGEVDGQASNMPSAAGDVASGLVRPLFVLSTERHPAFPDVPAITEVASITGENLKLIELWGNVLPSSVLWVASPGIPEDRLNFLRGLAREWVQNEGFQSQINFIAGFDITVYPPGEEVSKQMVEVASFMEQYTPLFNEMIEKYRA